MVCLELIACPTDCVELSAGDSVSAVLLFEWLALKMDESELVPNFTTCTLFGVTVTKLEGALSSSDGNVLCC